MTELFQGVKPCTTCKHYEFNKGHKCKKQKQPTETARLINVTCHTIKGK